MTVKSVILNSFKENKKTTQSRSWAIWGTIRGKNTAGVR